MENNKDRETGGQLQAVEEARSRRARNSPSGNQKSRRPGGRGLPGGAFAGRALVGAEGSQVDVRWADDRMTSSWK